MILNKKGGQAEKVHTRRKGGKNMKVEEALNLSNEESLNLKEKCKGFDDEFYKNHGLREEGENIVEFALKGSDRIKNDPVIRGLLKEDI